MSRYSHALVVGKFAPLHIGHQHLLDYAHALADDVTVVVWSNPDFAEMTNEVRAEWIRSLYPTACVIVGHDGPLNDEPDEVQRDYTAALFARHGRAPDVVITREQYGPGLAAHLGIAHEWAGAPRTDGEPSGSRIRADVHSHRHLLDPSVYSHFVERVVLMGAESTGKSTLTARLAHEYGTQQVQEYGREHYAARGGQLDLDDYLTIARVHREREDMAAQRANRYLFIDTNAVTTMFFSHYYNRGSLPELRELADECAARYRHVIVCDDDIPFEQDGWRDNEVWRGRMHGMVLHDLATRRIPYHVVSGSLNERVAQVRQILAGEHVTSPQRIRALGPRPADVSS
jgi:NadR type nicotinamide-nucleotide adenylyltransferase